MEFESMDMEPVNMKDWLYYAILYKTWATTDFGVRGSGAGAEQS